MERAELARLLSRRSAERKTRNAKRTLINEPDQRRFLAAFTDAVAGTGEIFLCNPDWGANERAQLDTLLAASGSPSSVVRPLSSVPSLGRGWLMIPTGGTGGRLKFARHDEKTLAAAVEGFTRHFAVSQVNAVGVLPLHHVSGLMAWMRCALTGGEYRPLDWKAVEAGALPALPGKAHGWMISLVPTQLERLLRSEAAVKWLKKFRIIFLGGGPAWPELLDRAAALRLPLSLGYGLTESAAMVSALRPEEFLAGARSCGPALPHATVKIDGAGVISLGGESMFRGHYPAWRKEGEFVTGDSGCLDERGHLHVTGRRDTVIISGGEKIDPAEVEAVLRGTGEFVDVVVLGLPDTEWGHVVVAAYPGSARPNLKKVAQTVNRLLSPAKRPKHYIPLAIWPASSQRKINRMEMTRLVGLALRASRAASA